MDASVSRHIEHESEKCLRAYAENPKLILEHAGIEAGIVYGGYGGRQIYELIQNGADAMLHLPGRIEVVATETALYCANEGTPIDCPGADVLLSSSISHKRGDEIGRFGMGFKSVLALTDRPAFFGSSGSFQFSADLANRRIRPLCPEAKDLPILRIAEALDTRDSSLDDPTLERLLRWATTVVRLPYAHDHSWLDGALRDFPAEFLLFAPHVRQLALTDERPGGTRRVIEAERPNTAEILLVEKDRRTTWRVYSSILEPDASALQDAGDRSGRARVPLSWAVPMIRQEQIGSLWAFFPTTLKTSLSGILNAPWKTNEDRLNLLPGPFNYQLIAAAAELVLKSLPRLFREDDPGSILDVLPGQEPRGWADERLSRAIYRLATEARIVANQDAKLEAAGNLKLPPKDLPPTALDIWSSSPTRPRGWAHASLEKAQRRSRLERIADGTAKPVTIAAWLEALVFRRGAAESITALRCAEELENCSYDIRELREARIVLTATDDWVGPEPLRLFLPSEDGPVSGTTTFVHHEVASDKLGRSALFTFGIREANPESELRVLTLDNLSSYGAKEWARLWHVASAVGDGAKVVLRPAALEGKLCVKNMEGDFVPLTQLLLPGGVLSPDDAENCPALMDTAFHEAHLPVLRALGATDSPVDNYPFRAGTIFDAYRRFAVDQYKAKTRTAPRDRSDLSFDRTSGLGPLDVFDHLSEKGRAAFTRAALLFGDEVWRMRNSRQPKLPAIVIDCSPCTWLLRRRGVLPTSWGPRLAPESFSSRLENIAPFLPIAELPVETCDRLGLRTTLKAEDLATALELSLEIDIDDEKSLSFLYAMAAPILPSPNRMRCKVGDVFSIVSPTEIKLVVDSASADLLRGQQVPYLQVSAIDAKLLSEKWGPSIWSPDISTARIEVEPGDPGMPVPLFDRFPQLRGYTADEIVLVSCTSVIVREISDRGTQIEPRMFYRQGAVGYYADSLDEEELVNEIARNLVPPLDALLANSLVPRSASTGDDSTAPGDFAALNTVRQVRAAEAPADKLLALLGEEAIRRRLPIGLQEAVKSERGSAELSAREMSEIALALYATDVLQVYRAELAEAGLAPPAQWAGSYRAREFVTKLGFSASYAGMPTPNRDPLLEVPGRRKLPELHEYQQLIVDQMQHVLVGQNGFRAFISLPTGAGKTRVAVQGLITAMAAGRVRKPILWVAQQDELCEQAVQTWREAWVALGPAEMLHINRLWGSNRISRMGGFQVVIATIAKLDRVCGDAQYEWLRDIGALIIDEAHTSVTPSYTQLLVWSGFGRVRDKDHAPLIGLSATPERGNEIESQRLVERYDNRRLDANAFGNGDAYEVLQDMGVLARVHHECIDGSSIMPKAADLEQFRTFKRLTPDFEERLGRDSARNSSILRSIEAKPADWPILVFATSVEHAEILAALLTLNGISAACITGQTPDGARADAIQRFRAGTLRVLTNYAVLSQGFDAPAVRAVYVTRPTFSANLYQQMIGRGLRGPKNGGKLECLIVNVDDNVEMYGEKLAFHQFAYLWGAVDQDGVSA